MDFIFKVNFSNHMFVQPQDDIAPPLYKVCVGRGNNGKLIKAAFKSRWWWQIVDMD